MHPIPEILEELRAGRMIVLVDDEDRENEGDLVCAAQFVTPQVINFMLREARGMMCVALAAEVCDRLELDPLSRVNTTQRGTAYTVTVDADASFGITTGVSATDRATTIKMLADPKASPDDFARPGHVQPLRARDGGSLVRAGQTEGSVDLCRLAGLQPAAVIIEVMNDDGSMARRPQLETICARHGLKMCSVAELIEHRLAGEMLVERTDTVPLRNNIGEFTLIAYRSLVDPFPHVALVCGDVGKRDALNAPIRINEPVLVRMHSQNLLGDVFGDVNQPSDTLLHESMRMIHAAGRGAVVYLRHEGMGTGLLQRLQSRSQPDLDMSDRIKLGSRHPTPGTTPPANKGAYGIGCQILRDLGIHQLQLLTNHPFHPTALAAYGLSIAQFVPISVSSI